MANGRFGNTLGDPGRMLEHIAERRDEFLRRLIC
jgi:hypothetical protein